ncbi:MAG TPA: hypothetical protein VEF06_09245 [Bryobacteraceae bacterium]|nr:hypothetical protein [Bryobacteraceae bacterium]
MALEFLYRDAAKPARVALFPGSWNPPTIAHAAIARAARSWADEVVWILPRAMPHKTWEGARFEDRRRMIELLARAAEGFSAAVSEGGLYADIAREAREFFAPGTEIALVLGRDAAERIAGWDYGPDAPDAFEKLIAAHPLLVAAREGEYAPEARHRGRIVTLPFPAHDDVSSSEVRRRIAAGEPWRHLVPEGIASLVAGIYGVDSSNATR